MPRVCHEIERMCVRRFALCVARGTHAWKLESLVRAGRHPAGSSDLGGRQVRLLARPTVRAAPTFCVRARCRFFTWWLLCAHQSYDGTMMGRRHRGWDFDSGFLSSLHVRRFLHRASPRGLQPTDQPRLKESRVFCVSLRLPDLRYCGVLRCVEGAPRSDRWPWSHA